MFKPIGLGKILSVKTNRSWQGYHWFVMHTGLEKVGGKLWTGYENIN